MQIQFPKNQHSFIPAAVSLLICCHACCHNALLKSYAEMCRFSGCYTTFCETHIQSASICIVSETIHFPRGEVIIITPAPCAWCFHLGSDESLDAKLQHSISFRLRQQSNPHGWQIFIVLFFPAGSRRRGRDWAQADENTSWLKAERDVKPRF